MGNCISTTDPQRHEIEQEKFSTSTARQDQRELENPYASAAFRRRMELGESSTSATWQDERASQIPFEGITPQASSSSSTVMKKGPWDVFINHRGCDTKHKLASTIYHTLDLIGLHAFLDENELELGDSIPHEIHDAMRTAGLHIAIFSERYAESPWCLAELCYMLKTGTPILPVFYHVNPDDLRWVGKGKGVFARAFSDHENKGRYPSSMLEDWKTALERVSNLSGHVLNSDNGDEGMLLKSIVKSVLRVIKKEPLEVAKHPVGMAEIVQDFERSQTEEIEIEQRVQIVGIVGFGGSGKTTLATELYNRKISSFHRSSFVHDVRYAASRNVLHTKQKKLLEDLRIQSVSFDNVREGKQILADQLKRLRVLIVLDDVDNEDQFDALLPPKESLRSGTVIIVTTRERDVLTKCGISSVYKMQPLQHLHAKQLFCWHAFLQPFPQEGFEELVENCLNVCNGLPLSLKVIGGQLYGKRSRDYWVSQLDMVRRILPKEILQRLQVSYDALDEDEQEIFLDIACFFIGERRSSAIAVWDGSGWSGLYSWETLHNKCLVELEGEDRIRMHDHLRDLGRQIAKTHSPSRLWCQRQSVQIQRGIPIRGIMAAIVDSLKCNPLDSPPPFRQCLDMMRISNVRIGLQILLVQENDFTEECGELSSGLLWLRWSNFKHRCIPSWLSLKNIRVLEILQARNLGALWEDAHPPLELRELLIEDAPSLPTFPRSIGRLKHLKRLSLSKNNFKGLRGLRDLPEEFCQLHSLEYLALLGHQYLSRLPNRFGDLVNLRHIDLRFSKSLNILPVSFKQLIHLEYLNLSGCKMLTLESNILENLTSLKFFDVSRCFNLQALPHNISNQASLRKLNFRYTDKLRELPASIGQLSRLEELEIAGLPLLTRLPNSLGNLSNLATLTIESCCNLEYLPIEIGQLYSIQTLTIERCPKLYEMPSLARLFSLNNLAIKDCHKIKKIEGLEHLTSLEELSLQTCWMVPGIHSLGAMERLRMMKLRSDNISAFESCIQSIQIEMWPFKMTICGRIFPQVESILDSFTFTDLAVVNSLERLSFGRRSLTCWETNLSNAAVVCYLVRSVDNFDSIGINKLESTRVELHEGEWIVISVFRQVSSLIKDSGPSIQALISKFGYGQHEVYRGWLIVGERGNVVQGFKQLFQTFCKNTSMS